MKKISLLSLIFLTISFGVKAQNYAIDSLFAEDGVFQTQLFGSHLNSEIILRGNNEMFITGSEYSNSIGGIFSGDESKTCLYKMNTCGAFDMTYGVGGKLNDNIINVFPEKFIINTDNSSYIIGYKLGPGGFYPFFSKINPQGFTDTNFQIQPISVYRTPLDIDYDGRFLELELDTMNQKILGVGSYSKQQVKGVLLMQFNIDGSIDSSAFDNGKLELPIINETNFIFPKCLFGKAVKIDEERYLLCGNNLSATNIINSDSLILAMVNKAGYLDSTFGTNGILIDTSVSITSGFTSKFDIYTEIIVDNIYISTREYENNRIVFNTRKYNFNGVQELNFGINGKYQITSDSLNLFQFNMQKVFDNKLLLSALGNIPTSQGVYENTGIHVLLNEDGTVNNEYDFLFNNQSEFNQNNFLINDIRVDQNSKIYLAGTTQNSKFALLAFTTESLVPHLSINGDSITAQINASNVAFQWSVNGTILQGETNSTLAISSIGQYVVTVFDTTACGSYSDTLNIQFVNINKITHHKTRVFPNPAVDLLSIQADEQIETLTLFDVTGREIFRKMNVPKSVEINISDLPCGIYFIKANDETSKFIKTD